MSATVSAQRVMIEDLGNGRFLVETKAVRSSDKEGEDDEVAISVVIELPENALLSDVQNRAFLAARDILDALIDV